MNTYTHVHIYIYLLSIRYYEVLIYMNRSSWRLRSVIRRLGLKVDLRGGDHGDLTLTIETPVFCDVENC